MKVEDLLQGLEPSAPEDLSPARRRQRDLAIALIRDEGLLEAAYSFNEVRLQDVAEGKRLYVGGEILPIRGGLPKRGELTALACCVCTLGPRLEVRVDRLFTEKRTPLALALDSLGNELLLALGRRMQSDLLASVRRQKLILGQRIRVGESELDISAKATVLRLAEAAEIGVNLHRGHQLWPQRSSAMVLAIGRNLPKLSLSRYRG
jgi:hypothetical protein